MSSTAEPELRVRDEFSREYLNRRAVLRFAPSTLETYDSHLVGYEQFLADRDTAVLTAEFVDVLEFVEHCVYRRNRESTIRGKLTTVQELYYFIRLRTDSGEDLCFDPLRLREIDVGRYRTPEPIQREALSRTEIRELFDAFDSYRNRLMAVVAIETGLRNSDLRDLKLADLDLDNLEIHVRNPKGSNSYDIPISADLGFELSFWNRHHRGGFDGVGDSEYVFLSQYGGKLETNGSFARIVREAAERAGIQGVIGQSQVNRDQSGNSVGEEQYREWHRVTPHTLRHSYITLLNEAGVELPYRQLVANHRSPITTRGYTHGNDSAFDLIRSRFNPPR